MVGGRTAAAEEERRHLLFIIGSEQSQIHYHVLSYGPFLYCVCVIINVVLVYRIDVNGLVKLTKTPEPGNFPEFVTTLK